MAADFSKAPYPETRGTLSRKENTVMFDVIYIRYCDIIR